MKIDEQLLDSWRCEKTARFPSIPEGRQPIVEATRPIRKHQLYRRNVNNSMNDKLRDACRFFSVSVSRRDSWSFSVRRDRTIPGLPPNFKRATTAFDRSANEGKIISERAGRDDTTRLADYPSASDCARNFCDHDDSDRWLDNWSVTTY